MLGIACTIMMIPSFSSLIASVLVLILLARYGSAKLAMGPIRRRTTSEMDTNGTDDLETGLLSNEQKDADDESEQAGNAGDALMQGGEGC